MSNKEAVEMALRALIKKYDEAHNAYMDKMFLFKEFPSDRDVEEWRKERDTYTEAILKVEEVIRELKE